MLVLSRKSNDRILFPTLGITIHVLKVDGRSVRLGVEAPRDVHVLRHEIAPDLHRQASAGHKLPQAPSRHRVRNRLNTALLSLGLLQRQVELEQLTPGQIDAQLSSAIALLEEIDAEFARPLAPPRKRRLLTASVSRSRVRRRSSSMTTPTSARSWSISCRRSTTTWRLPATGRKSLDYCAVQDRPDVILLDMMMPLLDGPATVRRFRSDPKLRGVKLFAVSGLDPKEAAVEIGPGGVDRWFTKPIRASALVREIDRELAALA